jgi:2-polyprenyl-6-methoxyphenol hydroxylase-like FAD-dependent oxidoreductase
MQNSLLQDKKVAIIGGGPVGLTTARLLQMKGVAVTVYERDLNEQARISGGTLDIHKATGQKTLAHAGLIDALFEQSRPVGMCVADVTGKVLLQMKPDKSKPEVDRPVLRKILYNSLAPGTVAWNTPVTGLKKHGNVFQIVAPDDSVHVADVVIIADGGRSKARQSITDELPEETGTFVIQGEIAHFKQDCPVVFALTGESNLACVQDRKTIFLQNRSDGSLCYYVSFRRSKQWLQEHSFDFSDKASVLAFLDTLFAAWSPIYRELFKATSSFNGFPLRVFQPQLQKQHGFENATVVGDAAHVMTPFGGMGVNMGLKDAFTLTENLTGHRFTTIADAIADYERQMVAYAKPVQEATSQADDRIHHTAAHALFNMKKRITINVLKVINWAAIFFLMLTVGVFWGLYLSLSRSYQLLSLSVLIDVGKILVANLAMPMRFIAMTAIALMGTSIYLQTDKKSKWFYFSIAGILCLIIPLVLTVAIEVPVNNQILSWTPLTAPANWETFRNKWQIVNVLRVIFALMSFGFFTAGVVKPFHKELVV